MIVHLLHNTYSFQIALTPNILGINWLQKPNRNSAITNNRKHLINCIAAYDDAAIARNYLPIFQWWLDFALKPIKTPIPLEI